MPRHWIAMAGLHGCLPTFCTATESHGAAVDTLADLHELGQRRRRRLSRDNYLELNPDDGNEYAEISTCDCAEPASHSDE